MFACNRFKYYCYGHEEITVETDHQPLVGLLSKDINSLSPRLAAMRLQLLSYAVKLNVTYKPGKELIIADTLSRACPQGTDLFEDLEVDPLVSVCSIVIKSEEVMAKYKKATESDEELSIVSKYIKQGWPTCKKSCASRALPFWNLRHHLSVVNGVIFYGNRLVIPVMLRDEVVKSLHTAHQGVTKTLQRASVSIIWPGLRHRIEETCRACNACSEFERNERKEPLRPFSIPQYPFQTLGIDLFYVENSEYLIVVDYLTKWPIVRELRHGSSSKVVTEMLKEIFSDFGTPMRVVSDNGPQFSSRLFREFCAKHDVQHDTSSPLHSSGNGQVERTIGTVKGIMKRCISSGTDWHVGLLHLKNTPIDNGLPSPAELLQGRILRDSMPTDTSKYQVRGYDLSVVHDKLAIRQSRQKHYHDAHSGPEKSVLKDNQQCHFKTANKLWIPGKVIGVASDRSYNIEAKNGNIFRRNRKDVRVSSHSHCFQTPKQNISQPEVSDVSSSETLVEATNIDMPTINERCGNEQNEPPDIRKSTRVRKPPAWLSDYV